MSSSKKTLPSILERLKPLVLANDMSGLAVVFDEFSVDVILSKDFINYCRYRNELSIVIFICSLYIENINQDLEIIKILGCYQHIQSKGKLPTETFTINNLFLKNVCECITKDSAFEASKIPTSNAIDYLLAIQIALDFDKPKIAKSIILANSEKLAKNKHFILLAVYFCNRNSAIDNDRHADWEDVIYIYEYVFEKIKSDKNRKLNSKMALSLTKVCVTAKNYRRIFKLSQYVTGHDDDDAYMKFQLALSSCHLNETFKSIKYLDELLSSLCLQNDDFIRNKLNTHESASSSPKKALSNSGISLALNDLLAITSSLNNKIFLVSGTLLGFAREKNILSHDKDVDVGIINNNNINHIISELKNSNKFIIKIYHFGEGNIYSIGLVHKLTNSPIDIFIYHQDQDKWVTGVEHAFGYVQNFAFTPFDLIEVNFLGIPINIPKNFELNLEENFGDWKIPDKNYISHLESPSTVDKGGVIYMLVLRLELLKAIREFNQEKLQKINFLNNSFVNSKFSISNKLMEKINARWLKEITMA